MKKLIKQVAKQNGVSVNEVRREIAAAIKEGMSSTEPEAVLFWSQFGGKVPTPEQLITVLLQSVSERV